jgi:hypothetical protein
VKLQYFLQDLFEINFSQSAPASVFRSSVPPVKYIRQYILYHKQNTLSIIFDKLIVFLKNNIEAAMKNGKNFYVLAVIYYFLGIKTGNTPFCSLYYSIKAESLTIS